MEHVDILDTWEDGFQHGFVGLELITFSICTLHFQIDLLRLRMFIPRLEVLLFNIRKASCETFQDSLKSRTDCTEILAVLLPPDEWQDQHQLLNIFRGKDLVDVADGNAECVQRETRVLLNHLDWKLVYFELVVFSFGVMIYFVSC